MERLQKLSDQAQPSRHALFVIQPFYTTVESMITDNNQHISYYLSLVCDTEQGLIVSNTISQSVSIKEGKYFDEQCSRVIETAIADVLEEFMVLIVGDVIHSYTSFQ